MKNNHFDCEGWTMYVNSAPCSQCQAQMTDLGIKNVIWPEGEIQFA